MHKIYVAGGCFWGVEEFFRQFKEILNTTVGYANGDTINPTYEEVCRGNTGSAETVEIVFNENKITIPFILEQFFKIIDPTSINKQGNDIGTQYRTGIYYNDLKDKEVIENFIKHKQAFYKQPIVVEVLPLKSFYAAEKYHQKHLEKNPGGYCHIPKALFKLDVNK